MSDENKRQGQKPQTMTKRAAIEEATAQVTPLFEIEAGRWSYHVWSTREGAWIPALRADPYREALRKRASTVAAMAADLLLGNGTRLQEEVALQIIGLAFSRNNKGSVSDRVNRILDQLR